MIHGIPKIYIHTDFIYTICFQHSIGHDGTYNGYCGFAQYQPNILDTFLLSYVRVYMYAWAATSWRPEFTVNYAE